MEQTIKKFKLYRQIGSFLLIQAIICLFLLFLWHQINHSKEEKFSDAESLLCLTSLGLAIIGGLLSSYYNIYSVDEAKSILRMNNHSWYVAGYESFKGGYLTYLQPLGSSYARNQMKIFSMEVFNAKDLPFVI